MSGPGGRELGKKKHPHTLPCIYPMSGQSIIIVHIKKQKDDTGAMAAHPPVGRY